MPSTEFSTKLSYATVLQYIAEKVAEVTGRPDLAHTESRDALLEALEALEKETASSSSSSG